jgi:hypothetical protein
MSLQNKETKSIEIVAAGQNIAPQILITINNQWAAE